MSTISDLRHRLSGKLSGENVVRAVYAQLRKRGSKIVLSGNKDADWRGGFCVNFGWHDEHRYNAGWFRYPECAILKRKGQSWFMGVGLAEGGYIMNGYACDLRAFPLPNTDAPLIERVKDGFKTEGGFKSSILVAEPSELYGEGRVCQYWNVDCPESRRWNAICLIENSLPKEYEIDLDFSQHWAAWVIDKVDKGGQQTSYNQKIVELLVQAVEFQLEIGLEKEMNLPAASCGVSR